MAKKNVFKGLSNSFSTFFKKFKEILNTPDISDDSTQEAIISSSDLSKEEQDELNRSLKNIKNAGENYTKTREGWFLTAEKRTSAPDISYPDSHIPNIPSTQRVTKGRDEDRDDR